MSALLATSGETPPTKREIEDNFDGNICRCTGYRPILTGMKTFASDWSPEDEATRMKCLEYEGEAQPALAEVSIPFPIEAQGGATPVESTVKGKTWTTSTSVDQLVETLRDNADKRVRLVHGNTSFGIYPDEYTAAEVLVDIRLIDDLKGWATGTDGIVFGSGITYSKLLRELQAESAEPPSRLGAVHFMARRTAGTIVRNAASIGGNTMLTLEHIHSGDPFPSDVLTALAAVNAVIEWIEVATLDVHISTIDELVQKFVDKEIDARDVILVRYEVPRGGDDVAFAQKVALREVNSHSIVNATTCFEMHGRVEIDKAHIVFGGITPYPWHPHSTEDFLTEVGLSLDVFPDAAAILRAEVHHAMAANADRMASVPDEGFTAEYRADLTVAFLYKAIVNALLERDPDAVPPEVRSSGESTWGTWPVSTGVQDWKSQNFKAPMGEPYIKLMAMHQASGQVHYTHEIELSTLGLNAAFVTSRRALARFHYTLPDQDDRASTQELSTYLATNFDGFRRLITAADIPPLGINNQGIGGDQPLFAVDEVRYSGQALSVVLATTEQEAIAIADYVSQHCVGYGPIDWPSDWQEPILTLKDAIAKGSIFPDGPKSMSWVSHVWKIIRPGSSFDWANADKDPLDDEIIERADAAVVDGIPCVMVESALSTGGQIHFYMETQACVAIPVDGTRINVHPSTQSPLEMHGTVAAALGVEHNQVTIDVRQVGGAFGGKTEQTRFVAGPVAVAAHAANKPVRMAMKREVDSAMIGHRHPYYGQSQIAIDDGRAIGDGESRPDQRGIIRGMQNKMWGDGGAFYDCSFIVSNCVQLRSDNAYRVKNFENRIDVCRTNTAPNTAMRAFGDIQSTLIIENAIDDAAFAIGMTAEEVREKNLYERGDVTPFGQALTYCYMREVWEYTKAKSCFDKKSADVADFNAKNRWRKQGIALVPVKYGSGYNLTQLEQASAVISVYQADGSIVIHQGGTDMGQGMMTKIEQLASYVLGVPMHMVRIESVRTSVIPNPTSTGGSTGTAYNGEAVKQVCEDLRSRLRDFAYKYRDDHGDAMCVKAGIDFWNYPETGWNTPIGKPGHEKLIWQHLVALAYTERVSLIASFNAQIPGGEEPVPTLYYKSEEDRKAIPGIELAPDTAPGGAVDSFVGFTYSAACAVVEIDVLTGETKVLSSDIVYDMGWSLNPAIDIGQVEGAFVQGIGYVLTEKIVHQSHGDELGRQNTNNTWTYKPPAITTIPLEMNTYLYPRDDAAVPESPNGLFSSKEVGEPPLVLAASVYLALKSAVRASRVERDLDGLFRLDAPATVQEVRRALDVSLTEQ